MQLICCDTALDLSGTPAVMGILNVTPDSFSDGGRYLNLDAAVARADEMLAEGADIIDVGPESSRPGALAVEPNEQIRRAVPVVAAIRESHPDVVISVDTTSAAVAAGAIDAGANLVNDISAMRVDPEMAGVVARTGAGVVLMHMRGDPATMQDHPRYDSVVGEVRRFLAERTATAVAAGIEPSRIVIDPGIGFGKTVEHNTEMMRRLDEFTNVGPAVLLGVSRKSVVRAFVGGDDVNLLAGSLMCVLAAACAGVRIMRVHDVAATVEMLRAARAAFSSR